MLKVYLLRHGETTYNADGNRYCGRTDAELTSRGLDQASQVHAQLGSMQFDGIYSSPLTRAHQTARIASGNRAVITDERLIELDFGRWEGKTKEEFIAEDPLLWDQWMEDPGTFSAGGTGDNGQAVVQRVDAFFDEMLKKYPSGSILVVAHNGVNRLFLAHKLGMPLKNYRRIFQENSSITLFELNDDGELTLKLLNSNL